MNRLSPLIARAPAPRRAFPIRVAEPAAAPDSDADPVWLKDLKFFATGWIGGLVFFGTLFS